MEDSEMWSTLDEGQTRCRQINPDGFPTRPTQRIEAASAGRHSQGNVRLDFFFTTRGVEMQRTPLGMLRSLLNQLFDHDISIRPRVRKIYEQRCRQLGYDHGNLGECQFEWPQVVLENLLTSTILESANTKQVLIFVDALDEAGAESAQYLAAYFHRLINRAEKENLTLQICISCRHYPIVESAQAREIHVEAHNQDDIVTYINDMLLDRDIGEGLMRELKLPLAGWWCCGERRIW